MGCQTGETFEAIVDVRQHFWGWEDGSWDMATEGWDLAAPNRIKLVLALVPSGLNRRASRRGRGNDAPFPRKERPVRSCLGNPSSSFHPSQWCGKLAHPYFWKHTIAKLPPHLRGAFGPEGDENRSCRAGGIHRLSFKKRWRLC